MNLYEALEADEKRVRGRFSSAEVWATAADGATLCARRAIGKDLIEVLRAPVGVSFKDACDRGLVLNTYRLDGW